MSHAIIAEPPINAYSFGGLQERCLAHMASNGISFEGPIAVDGRIRRFSVDSKKRARNEWYIAWAGRCENGNEYLNCVYGSWSETTTLDGKYTFTSWEKDDHFDEEERKHLQKVVAKRKKETEIILKNERDEAAKRAQEIWDNSPETPPSPSHSRYCSIKKIPYAGTRFGFREIVKSDEEALRFPALLVPLYNIEGQLRSLQYISVREKDKKSFKSFLAGGEKRGCFSVFGKIENGTPIGVSEGFATGKTCFEALKKSEAMQKGGAIVIAFDCGNLDPVTEALRKKYSKSPITIFGDDDVDNPSNPGKKHASSAARKFQAKVIFPKFPKGGERSPDGKLYSDFNDLALVVGLDEVAKQISSSFTPVIPVEPGKIYEAVDAAEGLILRKNLAIYQRGGLLVRTVKIGRSKSSQFKNRDPENLIIIEVEPCFLTEKLTEEGCWATYDKKLKRYKGIDCPVKISQTLLARREWKVPCLSGIIRAPTLRPDGSILETPGYDEATGLFFHADGYSFPKMLGNPTKEEALMALEIFKKLLEGFPFESSEERSNGKSESFSVSLSAILTALIRRSIGTAPLHGFSSPKMATGKSLLADIVSLTATGREMTAISQSVDEAEERKRLLSVLMEGDSIICYDNIERAFGSAALCSVLTQWEYKDRILGASKSASVPTNATFLATGNNLSFIGDISTRVLLCRLNADVERPEEREFDVDLRSYIPAHRGSLVQAGLTILKAYEVAGRPKQNIRPFGRFEEWSDWVRSAIVWLDEADPCDSRKEIEEADPVRISLIRLLAAWYEIFDNYSQTVKNVINKAHEKDQDGELLDALLEIAPNSRGDSVCPRRLGNKLASFNQRIEGGFRLEKAGTVSRAALWRVKKI